MDYNTYWPTLQDETATRCKRTRKLARMRCSRLPIGFEYCERRSVCVPMENKGDSNLGVCDPVKYNEWSSWNGKAIKIEFCISDMRIGEQSVAQ